MFNIFGVELDDSCSVNVIVLVIIKRKLFAPFPQTFPATFNSGN